MSDLSVDGSTAVTASGRMGSRVTMERVARDNRSLSLLDRSCQEGLRLGQLVAVYAARHRPGVSNKSPAKCTAQKITRSRRQLVVHTHVARSGPVAPASSGHVDTYRVAIT